MLCAATCSSVQQVRQKLAIFVKHFASSEKIQKKELTRKK